MPTTLDTTTLRDELTQAQLDAKAAYDPEALKAETTEAMRDFGPDGRWAYAPREAKEAALREIEAEQAARQVARITALEAKVGAAHDAIEAAIGAAREALPPLSFFAEVVRGDGYNPDQALALDLLAEHTEARLLAQVPTARPSQVDALYATALAGSARARDGRRFHTPRDGVVIAFVEAQYGAGWPGPPHAAPEEATAARKLSQRIIAAQEGRIPHDLLDRRAQIAEARKYARRMRTIRGEAR